MSSILIKDMEMPKDKPICIIIDPAGQARRYDLNNDKYADDELFETAPAADVRPVVRGKWILKDDGRAHCSICDMSGNSYIWNFCPICGADMRPSKEDKDADN